jgi:hypothetical protein
MTALAALQSLIAQGESKTLELTRSTAELKGAEETLCAFLNGDGGKVQSAMNPICRALYAVSPHQRPSLSSTPSKGSARTSASPPWTPRRDGHLSDLIQLTHHKPPRVIP